MSDQTMRSEMYAAPKANIERESDGYDETSMFNPKGRAGRIKYIGYVVGFSMLVGFLFSIIAGVVGASGSFPVEGGDEVAGFTIAMILAYILVLIPIFIFGIRRFHDFNASGWWIVTTIIPFVGIIPGLIMTFMPGTAGSNRFGNPPTPPSKLMSVLIIGLFLIFIIGIIAAVAIPAYNDYIQAAGAAG